MRILITFIYLKGRTGGELYVYELAFQLLKLGHTPIIFTGKDTGPLFDEIKRRGIPITTDLETINSSPDIIMGNSHEELMLALLYFPNTPAVFVGHDRFAWYAVPPKSSRLFRYLTPSKNIADGFIHEHNIPENKSMIVPNSVDTQKFKSRPPLPDKPKRALVFSNSATPTGYPLIIRQVCAKYNMTLDLFGSGVGNQVNCPENLLPQYDLVFARGRCALEALAVGCAVILCDIEGLGQLVTINNVENLRYNNFGWRTLQNPITSENITTEILKYDASDAEKVSQYIRSVSSLEKMTHELVAIFDTVIKEHQISPVVSPQEELIEVYQYIKQNSLFGTYSELYQNYHELMGKYKQLENESVLQKNDLALQKNAIKKMYENPFWLPVRAIKKIHRMFKKILYFN